MTTGYMGNTSICREFVKNKTTGFGFTDDDDCKISCSRCATAILNESDTVLVVHATNMELQCIHCHAKTIGITTTADTTHLHSPPKSTPTTPSAPRARNTSDVSERDCAADAANAVASFSTFMDQHERQETLQETVNINMP